MQLYDHEFQGRGFLARLIRAAVIGQSPEDFVAQEMAILEGAASNGRDVEGAFEGRPARSRHPTGDMKRGGLDGSA